jgi:uncharacterized MAPEG superfamily protein
MNQFTMENPVFVTYVIASAIMILKIMGQGWMTVQRMMAANGGFLNPEDANPGAANRNPRPGQLDRDDYVDRSRRIHMNDLENIPAFLAAGFIFVAVRPPLWLAVLLMTGFVVTRIIHTMVYVMGKPHEVRATFFSIGSIIVIVMAVYALFAAVYAL